MARTVYRDIPYHGMSCPLYKLGELLRRGLIMVWGLTGYWSTGSEKFYRASLVSLGFMLLLLHQDLVEIAKTVWKPQKYTVQQYLEYWGL